jgi:hypothetical protein
MLYQLPNGKVIHLSVDEYLALNDEELHELANSGYGEDAPSSMFYGKQDKLSSIDSIEEENHPLDYIPDTEDTDTTGPFNIHDLPNEE